MLLEFQPQVLRLLLHREATSVLADTFELYANAYERSILLREFYGKEATLFTLTAGSNEEKEKAKKGLAGILEGVDVERKRRVLSSLKENLTTMYVPVFEGGTTLSDWILAASTTQTRVPSPMQLSIVHFGST
jgi:pumilio family protein 6